MDYTRHFATRLMRLFTPQHEPIPNTSQVPNSAGGYAFPVDRWSRLDRFLVLGSEGGTYYIGERALTQENAKAVVECLAEDGLRTVERILEVSVAGRAPKNDPALFALAIAAGVGDAPTQAKAWEVLDGPVGQDLAKKLEGKGVILLAWMDNGIRQITNSKRPIAIRATPVLVECID